jgi:hypothetical protein
MSEDLDTDAMDSLDDPFASVDEHDAVEDTLAEGPASTNPGDVFEGDSLDAELFESGDESGEGVDDMAVWNAFEEEIADGLDASDEDEFLGRLLGGLGRAAGVVGRGLGRGASIAGNVASVAQGATRVARGVQRVAGAVTPAALAAARLARMLGAPGVAGALGRVGQASRTVGGIAGQAGGVASSLGQTASGARDLMAQLSQLIGSGANEFEDFDAMADLMIEDGVDAAMPATVALAARAAARGLGFRNVGQLGQSARRAIVRGVAVAARELMRGRNPNAVRALPRLASSTARVATRTATTPQNAAQTVRRHLPHTARQVARNPRALRRLTRPSGNRGRAPVGRDPGLGRGKPSQRIVGPRTFYLDGPVRLTITPR